ncbi:hypothetical protein F5X68DRAFT_252919 [Plectosphaerella plurivora]|uniref:Uncharacterized protein n=1 Tax=Plectosphaerella plurivora TaxID=936078 RepID=A0A9P8V0F9_9PEZI|nr:hypothetical protein F5X68DRAFT_252919 [Plectosphaerella plurivora]
MERFARPSALSQKPDQFSSAPPTFALRSTSSVWTCISILILCSWSVLHLTIPEQFAPQNRRQRWNLWIALLFIKLKWTAITIIAPEVICGSAATSWISAWRNTPGLQSFAEQDGVPWSRAHTSFADIGGFVLRFHNDENDLAPEAPEFIRDPDQTVELQQFLPKGSNSDRLTSLRMKLRATFATRSRRYGKSFWRPHKTHESQGAEALALATARMRHNQNDSNVVLMEGDTWVLTSDLLYKVRSSGLLRSLPHITQADLDDKNKGDILVKLLAIIQVSWMICQVIIRATLGRPSSPLEIMTVAFAVSTFFFYLMSLDRPQNVNTPIYIQAERAATAEEMAAIALDVEVSGDAKLSISNTATPRYVHVESSQLVLSTFSPERAYVVAVIVGSLIFGGVHLFAWNSAFPTDVEKWLWRVSSLVTMTSPGITLLLFLKPGYWSGMVILCTAGFLFVLARLFITVEVFRSLYYLPPENYINTWAANIPHFG